MAISTRFQGEHFMLASLDDLKKLIADESPPNMYTFASIFQHADFAALLNKMLDAEVHDEVMTALCPIYRNYCQHPRFDGGEAFVLASMPYASIFIKVSDAYLDGIEARKYNKDVLDKVLLKRINENTLVNNHATPNDLRFHLSRWPEIYKTLLLDSIINNRDYSALFTIGNMKDLLADLQAPYASRIFQKLLDDHARTDTLCKMSNLLIDVLKSSIDSDCETLFISRIMKTKETWEIFIKNFMINHENNLHLEEFDQCSHYMSILTALARKASLKKLIIARLKEFDISLLHLVCDTAKTSPVRRMSLVQMLPLLFADGADPTWIPVSYQENAINYLLSLYREFRLPISIEYKNIIIGMLRAGIDPLATHASLGSVLSLALQLFPASGVVLLDLGVLPANQYEFMQAQKKLLCSMDLAKQPQLVDQEVLLSLLIYFNWYTVRHAQFDPLIKALYSMPVVKDYLVKKRIACGDDLAQHGVAEIKNDLRKLRPHYRLTRDILLTVCLMYARYYHEPKKHYFLSLLPKDIFIKILHLLDAQVSKQECDGLLHFCIANQEHYQRLRSIGSICLFGTKAMFVSAQSLAVEYDQLKKERNEEALAAFREKAKPLLQHHFSLFRLPAHAAALKNSLRDSALLIDCGTLSSHDRP